MGDAAVHQHRRSRVFPDPGEELSGRNGGSDGAR
jgi:hypothetical protein